MNAQTPPLNGSHQTLTELQTTPARQSRWRMYRWLIVGIAATVIAAASLALWLVKGSDLPVAPAAKRSATTALSSSATQQPTVDATTNHWKNTVDPSAIPLGDGHVATTPAVGYVDSCTSNFRGGGARHTGSWINEANGTWNAATKIAVEGTVHWSNASYTETTSGGSRILTTNDLPEIYPTGNFPINPSDPAYQYDTNPNHISSQNFIYNVPLNPVAAASPNCLPLGPIGVLNDGVVLFDSLDDAGRDAVAHETQDLCDGHPNGQEMYHYHNVPSCLRDKATLASTLIGYAFDGFGIYVERDTKGNLPTDADLDACHGRTSPVMWNGKLTSVYHYDATLEYPYTLGCFHGTSTVSHSQP